MNYIPPRRSDGTLQRQRVALPWPEERPFRILSIDGGGICGILPAAILTELERRFLGSKSIAQHFDLITGTSTGGLIALGLGAGMTASQLLSFYLERGAFIFPSRAGVGGALQGMLKRFRQKYTSIYDPKVLENELLRVFGDRMFGESRSRLCIPSFEGTHGEPWIYKTPHHPDYRKDRNERMVVVGRATSAAPTYFPAMETLGYRMVDGGLWANNPVMIGLVDALACFQIERRQIQILSLGCGESAFDVSDARMNGGEWQWRHAISGAMRAQSLNALGQAYLLVGKDRVMRLDAPASTNPMALDDTDRAIAELSNMARSLVESSGHRINELFLEDECIPYRPIPA